MPIEKITEQVDTLMIKLETTVDSVNNGILTDKNKKSLEDALEGFGAVGTDLKEGRGTLGKLLTDESIYNNLDDLTSDLKGNPWKLLYRPKPKVMKTKTVFVCQNCGSQSARWVGKCPNCEEWNSYVEETTMPRNEQAGMRAQIAAAQRYRALFF